MEKTNLTFEDIKVKYTNLKNEYENIINPDGYKIIERCNYIVEVNGQTISTDNEGKVFIANTNYPTQFTFETANEICANLKVTNGKNEKLELVMFDKKEWYQKEINNLNDMIERLEILIGK